MKRFEKFRNYTFATLGISLFIHIAVFAFLTLAKLETPQLPKPENIEVVILDAPPAAQPEDKKEQKIIKKQKKKEKQVVQQNDRALNQERPDENYFLSKNNQRVQKQTQAKSHGDFKNDAGLGQNGKSKVHKAKQKVSKQDFKLENGSKIKQFLPKYTYSSAKNFDVDEAGKGQKSQSNDYLKNIEEGKQTVLNTREFVYYAYYERIRGKIRRYWEPVIKSKVKHVFETGRKIASVDHKTAVIITLDKSGSLINVQVVDGSGVRDLDEAAVEAFKSAEPFPNPPDGIVESDGKIRINWNFILEA